MRTSKCPDGKCARNGCDNPHLLNSVYCSDYCRRKVHRDTYKSKDQRTSYYHTQRGAVVYDPACGPYHMGLERTVEAIRNDEFRVGTVIQIGEVRLTVG